MRLTFFPGKITPPFFPPCHSPSLRRLLSLSLSLSLHTPLTASFNSTPHKLNTLPRTMDVQSLAPNPSFPTSLSVMVANPGPNSETVPPEHHQNGGSDAGVDFEAPASNTGASEMAVVKMQKVYRSYRTRRKLADSAVVAEEFWWQALDYARLNHSTISFFSLPAPETAVSRWSRVTLNASKVGKGLGQDSKAQTLAFQHWIEAIDPRHRYGHNLHKYYDAWCGSSSGQPFFFWLDVGDGKDLELQDCPRSKLRDQCVKYLGPQEREFYEYIVVEGKIIHKMTNELLDTGSVTKWIFVMSTAERLYIGEKKKGKFHHSSFLAGGTTLAAGRLIAECGILKCIQAYSGHYRPTDDQLGSYMTFLKKHGVNLERVQIDSSESDDYKLSTVADTRAEVLTESESNPEGGTAKALEPSQKNYKRSLSGGLQIPRGEVPKEAILKRINSKKEGSSFQLGQQLQKRWSTGAGPRIGCVADYPLELRFQALEFMELSPRDSHTPSPFKRLAAVGSPLGVLLEAMTGILWNLTHLIPDSSARVTTFTWLIFFLFFYFFW